jgi:carboxypeptidase Taq
VLVSGSFLQGKKMAGRNAYAQLVQLFTQQSRAECIMGLAASDEMIHMPAAGAAARGEALAAVRLSASAAMNDPRNGAILMTALARSSELSADEKRNLHEIKGVMGVVDGPQLSPQWYQRTFALQGEKQRAASAAMGVFHSMARANDWAGYAPYFTAVVAATRAEAVHVAEARGFATPYGYCLDHCEKGATVAQMDALYADLLGWLPAHCRATCEAQREEEARDAAAAPRDPVGPFAPHQQLNLATAVLDMLGFDFNRGRLDLAPHAFCNRDAEDVRVAAMADPAQILTPLQAILHEGGHAMYEQGRPAGWRAQPLGRARSTAFHEAQATFFEVVVGHDPRFAPVARRLLVDACGDQPAFTEANLVRHFRDCYLPRATDAAGTHRKADAAAMLQLAVKYKTEKRLIDGDLAAADVPRFMDALNVKYFGYDTTGRFDKTAMQGIQWQQGMFGYFNCYALGYLYAAQFDVAMRRDLTDAAVDECVARGDLRTPAAWLRERVWAQGCRHSAPALVKFATGEELNPAHYRRLIERRFPKRD